TDPGADVLVTGGEPADTVTFAGQGGDDTLDTGVGVSNPAKAAFDGGAGIDHARYDGSSAADTISVARDGDAVASFGANAAVLDSIAVEDLTVSGFGGADTLAASNGIGALTTLT